MTARAARTVYRIVVRGEVGPRLAEVFDGFSLDHASGVTILVGPVRDPAELQGVLNLLAGLGIDIVSVMRTAPARGRGAAAEPRPGGFAEQGVRDS